MKSFLYGTLALAFVALSPAFEFTSSAEAQQNRRVRIINNTGYTMISFQASNVRRRNWEEDM